MTSDKDSEREEQPTATSSNQPADAIEAKPASRPPPTPVTATPSDASAKPAAPAPTAVKPIAPPKPLAPPPAPFVAEPSLPVSMENAPANASGILEKIAERRFDGELEEDFETALSRVVKHRAALLEALKRGLQRLVSAKKSNDRHELDHTERKVAFDGFRSELYDEKIERDRRYGTVYTVSEEDNAYLVRLEMPRRVPNSALKRVWNLADEMPDYDYSLGLSDGVLSIRGAVRGEALRRLAYVSPSFPSDFMTRIEFAKPVGAFRHRLRDKNLEIIVFKRPQGDVRSAA
jgi:hypothetical protein